MMISVLLQADTLPPLYNTEDHYNFHTSDGTPVVAYNTPKRDTQGWPGFDLMVQVGEGVTKCMGWAPEPFTLEQVKECLPSI